MEFNIKSIDKLEEHATYVITFPRDVSIEACSEIAANVNEYIKDQHRDILLLFTIEGLATINKQEYHYGI